VTLAAPAASLARAGQRERVLAWDWLRVLALLDVASHHTRGAHLIAGAGLPLFHMLSLALSSAARPQSTLQFARKRAARLLVPWLFWSGTLGALRALTEHARGQPSWAWLEPRMLLYGPNIALWFLPFTAAAGLAAQLARGLLERSGERQQRALLLVLFVAGLALLPSPVHMELGWPFDQWLFSVPSALFGFVIGRAQGSAGRDALLGAATAALSAYCLCLWRVDPAAARHALRFALAFGLLSAAPWLPLPGTRLSAGLRPLLFGVYILHPTLDLQLFDPLLWRLGCGGVGWLRLVFGVCACTGCVWLLRRTPLRRCL
jgi:hypothetical protein